MVSTNNTNFKDFAIAGYSSQGGDSSGIVYGLAPSDIIFHIATNYIFSFDTDNRISRHHFKQVDTRPAVKEGRLDELLAETFDDLG